MDGWIYTLSENSFTVSVPEYDWTVWGIHLSITLLNGNPLGGKHVSRPSECLKISFTFSNASFSTLMPSPSAPPPLQGPSLLHSSGAGMLLHFEINICTSLFSEMKKC